MQFKLSKVSLVSVIFVLSGCGLLPDKADDTKNWSASKLYAEAMDELASGGYDRAVQLFEKLESRYPFGTYAQQAQMEIAYAHYRSGDQAQALSDVERFIKLHPNHPNVDYMYYLRGLVNFNDRLGPFDFLSTQDPTERDPKATREAFDAFKQLVTKFPDSKYTPDARDRMHYLVNALAQHDVHVARYYFRRGAYSAALGRAQSAVTQFPGSPASEEALYLMVSCYDKLGLNDLRDDAARVFKLNYPNSSYPSGGPHPEKSWWRFW